MQLSKSRRSIVFSSIMDKLKNEDDLNEISLLENVSSEPENEDQFEYISRIERIVPANNSMSIKGCKLHEKSQQIESEFMDCDIEDCNSLLNFNKQIISFLLDLKKHITYALQKCERKLTVVETSLQKHTIGDTKVSICNAGMPYFKDRNYFFAPNNDDETLKENHKELQLRNLPKVTPWTTKERNTLLKAIREEAIADVLYTQRIERTRLNDTTFKLMLKVKENEGTTKRFPPTDLVEIVGPLQEREFDWFKISSIHFEDVHSPLDCRVMWNVFLHPDINKNCWTKPEDIKLKEIAKKCKFQNWDKIAKELNTKRTAYQCFIRYNTTKKMPKVRNCIWENGEDGRLLKLVEIFKIGDFIPWGEVASWMENRTKQQAYFRWTYSLAPYLTKGRFSKTEDNVLRDAVTKYGTNFCKISAALMPNRSTVQLHYRYQTLTTNQIENWNVWTLAEDSKLLELFERFGPNWSKIAKAFSCKTRTRLRHRHAALQKYINKGITVFDLHRNCFKNKNERGQEEKKEESRNVTFEFNNSGSNRDYNNDVDKDLIEYFRMKQVTEKSIYKRELYTMEELECGTKNLYSILQLLNAKLCIPDANSDLKLSDRDRQLLYSLREYTKTKNDKERHFEIIDKCSSLMFGTGCNREEYTRFVPPPPFDSQIKLRKSNETQCIDYHLNIKNAFLVAKPIDFDTPNFVISHIGGNEQELQFQKLSHSFEISSLKNKQGAHSIQDFCTFPIGTSLQQSSSSSCSSNSSNSSNSNSSSSSSSSSSKTRSSNNSYSHNNSSSNSNSYSHYDNNSNNITDRNNISDNALQKTKSIVRFKGVSGTYLEGNSTCDHSHVKLQSGSHKGLHEHTSKNVTLFSTFEKIQHFASVSNVEAIKEKDTTTIEATHATLLSFKNLMYLNQLTETCSNPDQFLTKSKRFQESFNLLETRLEQLFKYPIGLSKTVLPEVYVMDAFSYDDVAPKRKASEVSKILKAYKIKKLRSFNKNSQNLRQ